MYGHMSDLANYYSKIGLPEWSGTPHKGLKGCHKDHKCLYQCCEHYVQLHASWTRGIQGKWGQWPLLIRHWVSCCHWKHILCHVRPQAGSRTQTLIHLVITDYPWSNVPICSSDFGSLSDSDLIWTNTLYLHVLQMFISCMWSILMINIGYLK